MKRAWRYLFFSLALALLLTLAVLNQALFYAYLVEPIARILWLIYRTFLSIDQAVYWALLILAAFVGGLWMISRRREYVYRPAYHPSPRKEDRAANWDELLRSAEADSSARQALHDELEALYQSIEGLGNKDGDEGAHLPLAKVSLREKAQAVLNQSFLIRLMPQPSRRITTALDQRVDSILTSLEAKLKLTHEQEIKPGSADHF